MRADCFQNAIAITGIGCRFPGGIISPGTFWKFICEGGDGITEVPEDRWGIKVYYRSQKGIKGKVYTKKGGFLNDIDQFDPHFFNISPREANYMDPQQRLLMEVAWEALEDSGYVPSKLGGLKVGVYIGLFAHDYENIHGNPMERPQYGPHSSLGIATSVAANRLSYFFNFKGPSMVIDTACSSSLVAVHLACQSILKDESVMAVAGGVNVIIKPELTMALCEAGMLSPDGYCKSFDAGADGYTRSEGAAVVVLKRLPQALADEDPVYAVIRGGFVNQDGRGEGLSFPNADAQKKLLTEALRSAEIAPHEVQYMEAHGTGTPAGDPVEAGALGSVLSQGRAAANPCIVGSVKSNFGHTESAAGIAGLVKTALMLKHHMIPPNLHFKIPNPEIDFDRLKIRVPVALEPWQKNGATSRIAGINSFGFGGTNACVIVEEFDTPVHEKEKISLSDDVTGEKEKAFLTPLSAHTDEALKAVTASCLEFLTEAQEAQEISLSDIGRTFSMRKGHHAHRLSIVSRSKDEFIELLQAYLNGEKRPGLSTDIKTVKPAKLAFIFSGMGQQWWGMGRELLRKEPLFEDVMTTCDTIFGRFTDDWSLIQELTAAEDTSRINEARIAQPCIVSLQIALTELYRSWGVVPDAVLGHSVGEIAATYAAGILGLEDALLVAYHRSRLQQTVAGSGGMLAVGLAGDILDDLLNSSGYDSSVAIAAVNSPESVTISGDMQALGEIEEMLVKEKIFARFLRVDVPYHSPAMDAILPELTLLLEGIYPRSATAPFFSTATGKMMDGSMIDAAYWAKNVRAPVRFMEGFGKLVQADIDVFMELGAHPVLGPSMKECLADFDGQGIVLSTLKREAPEQILALDTAGRLYCTGYALHWDQLYEGHGKFIKLPPYPFQRARYWNESDQSRQIRIGTHAGINPLTTEKIVHPLLGARLSSAITSWSADIDPQAITYLADHVVQGAMVYPAAAFVETAVGAAGEIFGGLPLTLEDFEIKAPLVLENDNPQTLQVVVENENFVSIYGKPENPQGAWTKHACGKMERINPVSQMPAMSISDIRKRCNRELSREETYQRLSDAGLAYGEHFQSIEHVYIGDYEALGRLKTSDGVASELADYQLHPAVLDACFQVMASFPVGGSYLPVKIDMLTIYGRPGKVSWGHVQLIDAQAAHIKGDITLLNSEGNILVRVQGLQCRRVHGTGDSASDHIEDLLFTYQWQQKTLPDMSARITSDFLPSPRTVAKKLAPDIKQYWTQYARSNHYAVFEPQFDALAKAYILEAMLKLKWKPKKGDLVSSETLADRLGIASRHRLLFERLLHILANENHLNGDKVCWEVAAEFDAPHASKLFNSLISQYPAYFADLSLLQRCGARLNGVLRGEEDPLSIIFPQGSSLVEHLYQSAPSFLIYNRIVAGVISTIINELPQGETLRILEIGAGTGGLTSHILPLLPPNKVAYVYTDLSRAFVNQAQQRFRRFEFVEYLPLDIASDPESQGFSPHSFDIVLEANAIHAVPELRHALTHMKSLLRPHGMLILLEATMRGYALDLIFGMLEGWWSFSDFDLRPSHPLISGKAWMDLLAELDYLEPVCIGDREEKSAMSVVIARNDRELKFSNIISDSSTPEPTNLTEKENREPWIIFADRQGIAEGLVRHLESKRITPFLIGKKDFFEGESENYEMLADEIERILQQGCVNDSAAPVLVNLWGLDTPAVISGESLGKEANESCIAILTMVQTLMKRDWTQPPELWLVTAAARMVGGSGDLSIAQAPVWGLGRTIVNEHRDLQLRLVDLSLKPSADEIHALFGELFSNDLEDEIALRGQARYVHRFVQKRKSVTLGRSDVPFTLHNAGTGGVKRLSFIETIRKKPGPGEMELRVIAAGVNFKDIAKATGLLENADLSSDLGFECAGIVLKTGEGVHNFNVGDEVMGIVSNCFCNYAIADARNCVRKPPHFSFEEAASVLVTYLTGHYALLELAGIKKNERVLIHTATGGVGLSAIQIATAAGAQVLATAGNPEKRDFLRALGVSYVGDSRSLTFANEIMAHTNGEGVDIVLNTLPVKTITKSLSVLKPLTGRFVDIVNIYSDDPITLRAMTKGVSFFTFDLETIFKKDPDAAGILTDALKKISKRFDDKTYLPLPYRSFPAADITNAFLHMQKGRHIGKIVVRMDEADPVTIPTREKINVRNDGTYLITGGLGGFGLATAKWLADCGAKHLVLIGRSSASSPEALRGVEEIRAAGAQVLVERVDVTQADQLRGLMDHLDQTLPPLRGVIHAAMVLNVEYVMRMTASQMKNVINPKVVGAWQLHELTLNKPLDFFICFSSFASLVGNIGQGNYAAANAFLDSIAHFRRLRNLPALTICWGPVGESGYVMQHPELMEFFNRQGVTELTLKQAWRMICHGLGNDLGHVGLLKIDWPAYRQHVLSISGTRRFSQVFNSTEESLSSGSVDHPDRLRLPDDPEARHVFLMDLLEEKVAVALGIPREELDILKPLDSYGFDSLMATELVVDIEGMIHVTLPKMTLLQGGLTITGLVEIVEKELEKIRSTSSLPEKKSIESKIRTGEDYTSKSSESKVA